MNEKRMENFMWRILKTKQVENSQPQVENSQPYQLSLFQCSWMYRFAIEMIECQSSESCRLLQTDASVYKFEIASASLEF